MMEELPVLVVWKVRIDELAGVGEEVEGVQNVTHILHTRAFHNKPPRRPVTIHQVPRPVH